MWSALKSDLLDFVNTIQADTTNTLQKVLGDDEEQTTDEQALTEKLRADVKRSYETYANPLKENKVKEFEKYKKKFSLSGFAKDIAQVLDEEPEVSRFYAELVPVEISPEEFWARLFFRLHLLSRNGSATFEDDEDEEELIWDDEDTGIEITSSIEIPIGDLNLEFLKSQEQVQHLEMENRTLKSDLAVLTEKIRQLEERIRQLSGESQDKGQNYSNHNGPLSSNLIDTASVTSSDSSSILLVAHPTEASSREESDYDTKGKGSCSKSDTKILATLEDDEEDEEGWG